MAMARPDLVWRYLMNPKPYSVKAIRQFISYTLIGLLTNVLGYALYVALTYLWGSPKLTMTLLYCTGALTGFLANRRYTFEHEDHIGLAGARYLMVQFSGYLLNLGLLLLFVDWLGFSHQIVQAVAIVVVAIFLFVLLRIFVFVPSLTTSGVVRP